MLEQMRHGDALLVQLDHHGQPVMSITRREWMYR
jgi:hypothetical protein